MPLGGAHLGWSMGSGDMIGQTVSHYRIVEELGGGGMGVVYRAQDLRLRREVALKFLRSEALQDARLFERFQAEARAASALNHPYICTIHDIDQDEGRQFIVMELLEGATLADRLSGGPLPVHQILEIGVQLADALSVAHGKGIIHRDVKPANIFLTAQGQAKLLDFGIAKLQTEPTGLTTSVVGLATALGDGLTRPGEAVGTLAYMSPEQIRRKELDARTDLFALGGVLYEMATGQQAFPGPAPAVVCDAILHGSPTPPMRLNPELPARLEEIILRALDKDLDRRYQHASDLGADLKRLQRDFDSGRSPAPETLTKSTAVAIPPTLAHEPWHRWGPSLAVAILLAILGVLGRRFLPGADTLPAKIRPLTTDGGFKYFPSLSPDGEMVAYVRLDLTGNSCGNIYVKALFPGAKPLCLTEGSGFDGFPAWSPDGKQIAFLRGFKNGGAALVTIPSLGGRERKVSELHWRMSQSPGRPLPGAPSWSPDGQYLAVADPDPDYSAIRIYRVSLDTMETRTLTSPPEGFLGDVFPAFSPDGRHLAFCRSSSGHFVGTWDVWVQPAEGGDARRLTSGSYDYCWGLTWTSEGDGLVFSTMGQVLRVPLAGGEPEPLVGVGHNAISPSVQGDRMAYVQMIRSPRELWRLAGRKTPLSRKAPVKLVTSRGVDATPAYSPDGRRIAFSSSRSGVRNIWLCDSDCSDPVQLTDFKAHTGSPHWGPDGHRLVFESVEKGDWNLYIVDTEGGAPLQLTSQPSDENVPFWSRDGRWIYFHSDRSGRQQIWRMPAEGGAAVQLTQDGGCWAQESRDGRFVYYSKDQVEPSPLWRVPVDGGEETEILGERITPGHWALGRSGIYFFRIPPAYGEQGSRWSIQYIDLESREVTELFRKDGPFDHWPLAVSPDEEWILYGERPVGTSELMLVENFR